MTDFEILLVSPQKIPSSVFAPSNVSDLASFEATIKNALKSTANNLSAGLGFVCGQLVYVYYAVNGNDQNDQTTRSADAIQTSGLQTGKLDIVLGSIQAVFKSLLLGIIPSVYEVQVYLPSMAALESSPYYQRNGILMALDLNVKPSNGTASPSVSLPVRLPEPQIGTGKTITNGTAKIGTLLSNPPLTSDGTHHLGKQGDTQDGDFGQIRYYNMAIWKKISPQDLTTASLSTINQTSVAINSRIVNLPSVITDKTKLVRQAGRRLNASEWDDGGVCFTVPDEPGFVIIWRDDIPSIPIPFLSSYNQILAVTPIAIPTDFSGLSNLSTENLIQTTLDFAKQSITKLGIQPEQLIYVYYASYQDQNNVVRAIGVSEFPELRQKTKPKQIYKSPFPDLIPSIYEAQVYVPAMTQIQTSPNYKRNAVMIWQEIQILNKITNAKSDPAGFPLWLPTPHIGTPKFSGTLVEIGTTVTGPCRVDDTDNLGAACKNVVNGGTNDGNGGQIRWYAPSTINQIKMNNLPFSLTGFDESIDTKNNKVIVLPNLITDATKASRQIGTLIAPVKGKWHDDGVSFNIPDEPGFAIIWRDDIPSIPIPLFDNLKEYVEGKIAEWAKELWSGLDKLSWARFSMDVETGLPDLGVDNLLDLAILHGVASANNLLAQWIDDHVPGLSVKFAVILGKTDDQSASIAQADIAQAPSYVSVEGNQPNYQDIFANPPNGETLKLTLPWVNLQSEQGKKKSCFSLTLQLIINTPQFEFKELGLTIPALGPFIVPLGTYNFHRTRLLIPTMAVFFQNSLARNDWGAPLILLPEDKDIYPSGQYDANSTTGTILDQIKDKVTGPLDKLKTLLNLANIFVDSDTLSIIDKIIAAADSVAHVVINTTGDIAYLGNAVFNKNGDNFNDIITGVVLLGIPGLKNVSVECYVDLNSGDYARFALPDNAFIAVAPNVSDINRTYGNIPKPIVVHTNNRTDFNDSFTSISYIILGSMQQAVNS